MHFHLLGQALSPSMQIEVIEQHMFLYQTCVQFLTIIGEYRGIYALASIMFCIFFNARIYRCFEHML